MHSGIDLSVKSTCNAVFECDQNSFRSMSMIPISMKTDIWIDSVAGFGTELLCLHKTGMRKTIHPGKYHNDTVDGLKTWSRKIVQ